MSEHFTERDVRDTGLDGEVGEAEEGAEGVCEHVGVAEVAVREWGLEELDADAPANCQLEDGYDSD